MNLIKRRKHIPQSLYCPTSVYTHSLCLCPRASKVAESPSPTYSTVFLYDVKPHLDDKLFRQDENLNIFLYLPLWREMLGANIFDSLSLVLRFIVTLFNIVNFAVNFCLPFDHWMTHTHTHTSLVIPSSRKVRHIPEGSPKLHLALGLKFAPCVQRTVVVLHH